MDFDDIDVNDWPIDTLLSQPMRPSNSEVDALVEPHDEAPEVVAKVCILISYILT